MWVMTYRPGQARLRKLPTGTPSVLNRPMKFSTETNKSISRAFR